MFSRVEDDVEPRGVRDVHLLLREPSREHGKLGVGPRAVAAAEEVFVVFGDLDGADFGARDEVWHEYVFAERGVSVDEGRVAGLVRVVHALDEVSLGEVDLGAAVVRVVPLAHGEIVEEEGVGDEPIGR